MLLVALPALGVPERGVVLLLGQEQVWWEEVAEGVVVCRREEEGMREAS